MDEFLLTYLLVHSFVVLFYLSSMLMLWMVLKYGIRGAASTTTSTSIPANLVSQVRTSNMDHLHEIIRYNPELVKQGE